MVFGLILGEKLGVFYYKARSLKLECQINYKNNFKNINNKNFEKGAFLDKQFCENCHDSNFFAKDLEC